MFKTYTQVPVPENCTHNLLRNSGSYLIAKGIWLLIHPNGTHGLCLPTVKPSQDRTAQKRIKIPYVIAELRDLNAADNNLSLTRGPIA